MIVMKFFMFEFPIFKMFLICSYFLLISANLFVLTMFLLLQLQRYNVFI